MATTFYVSNYMCFDLNKKLTNQCQVSYNQCCGDSTTFVFSVPDTIITTKSCKKKEKKNHRKSQLPNPIKPQMTFDLHALLYQARDNRTKPIKFQNILFHMHMVILISPS